MSYIVFARKYRPQTFDEIVGQSHVTTTLKNAISQNRAAHAYLFAGPRGVGKTTTARIFAKALNCDKGPSPEPCNSCASCNEITQGSSLDILEIDGASNRGIDEIRNLKENVKFAPSRARFKLYIIDEVHMLTPEAFNALLKTLEEPPPHVKFIFATTQAHKVPLTILSRCQRFDFRRISTKDIHDNLKRITSLEKLNVKDEALITIAKYSDGSMRDGQVILDQMISFTQGNVELEDIVKVLGIVDEEILFGLSNSIKARNAISALKIIDSLINEGKDALQVVVSLIEHFRNISIIKISADLNSLIDVSPDKIKRYLDEAGKFTIEDILYIIYTLSNTIDFIRKSNLARVPLEAAMVKLTRIGSIVSLAEILDRINRLEDSLSEAKPRQDPAGDSGSACETEPRKNQTLNLEKLHEAKPESAAKPNTPGMDEILSSWNSVINYIKAKKISVASYLGEGYPADLKSNTLSIGFPEGLKFHKEVLESPENTRLIEEAVKESLKLDLKVAFVLVEPVKFENHAINPAPARRGWVKGNLENQNPTEDTVQSDEPRKAEIEPIIKSAMDIFGGTVLREIKGREGGLK